MPVYLKSKILLLNMTDQMDVHFTRLKTNSKEVMVFCYSHIYTKSILYKTNFYLVPEGKLQDHLCDMTQRDVLRWSSEDTYILV